MCRAIDPVNKGRASDLLTKRFKGTLNEFVEKRKDRFEVDVDANAFARGAGAQ